MKEFNVGDRVIIVRKYAKEGFQWVPFMDEMIGKTVTITNVHMRDNKPYSFSVAESIFYFMAGSFEKTTPLKKSFNELLKARARELANPSKLL